VLLPSRLRANNLAASVTTRLRESIISFGKELFSKLRKSTSSLSWIILIQLANLAYQENRLRERILAL
jgi:hypothetical protein